MNDGAFVVRRMQEMRDVDGLVHGLVRWAFSRPAWPSGHVDTRLRRVTEAPMGTPLTCFVCIVAWVYLSDVPRHLIRS